ncbi:MAG: DNA gyrase inhibitor YacG [Planctomycetota bacterium]
MSNVSNLSCPTCGRTFSLSQTESPPFCSRRCQLIDLGRWLNEEIGLPCEGEAEDEEPMQNSAIGANQTIEFD